MSEEKKSTNILLKYKKEIIMTSFFLLVAIISLVAINSSRKIGQTVEITQNGNVIAEYSLLQNGEYPLLDGKNILIIENGEAYLREADCPDKVCVKTGRISHVGESIICLPNRLAITVRGESDPNEPDFIS